MSNNEIETDTVDAPTGELVEPAVDVTPDTDEQPAAEQPADDEPADVFPREVVEKLRRESASYRERAKTAEDRLAAMQRQSVDRQITAAGMRPAAVWATAKLDDLLADDGTVDAERVAHAMAEARQTLGIAQRRTPYPGMGEMNSGATGVKDYTPGPGFEAAFGPRRK